MALAIGLPLKKRNEVSVCIVNRYQMSPGCNKMPHLFTGFLSMTEALSTSLRWSSGPLVKPKRFEGPPAAPGYEENWAEISN